MKRFALFVLVVGPIVYLLAFGLMRNARELPSAMIGKKAPDFSLHTLDNKTVTLQSLSGKPVVINFWATWCGPCLLEHKVFSEANKLYGKEFHFFGVVYQDQKENVEQFLKEYGEAFSVLLDPGSKMAIDYGVGGIPETFYVDTKGIIQHKHTGLLTFSHLQEDLEKIK